MRLLKETRVRILVALVVVTVVGNVILSSRLDPTAVKSPQVHDGASFSNLALIDRGILELPSSRLQASFEAARGTPITLPPRPDTSRPTLPLILGSIKSGISTLFAALVGGKALFRLEGFGEEGAVSWRLAANRPEDFNGVTPYPVFHLIRHPLSTVAQIASECFCNEEQTTRARSGAEEKDSLQYLSTHSPRQYPEKGQPIILQALQHWVDWNKLIMANFASSIALRVEDIDPGELITQLGGMNITLKAVKGTRSFESKRPSQMTTWGQLNEMAPPALVSEAMALATRFSYASHPPIYVTLLQLYCEDQVHYLVQFLSRMEYTSERPFRFVYVPETRSNTVLRNKKLSPYSLLILMALENKWQDYVELGAIYPKSVMMIHKDEYCEYDPKDIPNLGLAYHGYWDNQLIDGDKVHWVPLGVRKIFPIIFPHEILPANQRPFLFNLIVSLSTSVSRQELADIAKSLDYPSFIHTISEWNKDFVGYLGPEDYKAKLLQSMFTLSPRGHNIECYRIYEACEAGSIPIIEDFNPEEPTGSCTDPLAPFKRSNAPFIYITSWKDLPKLLEEITRNPDWILRKQLELLEWNRKFKQDFITDFERRLANLWGLP